MRVFLWTMVILLAVTCIGKLIALAKRDLPPRTPAGEALDVAMNAGLMIWAAVLLASA